MAARRAQVRQIFQSLPSGDLSGTTLEALYTRCEANLAAVDAWSTQGNQRAVRQAGTGLVAICAWMAAKTLANHAQIRPFQNASGLSPAQFNSSEIDLSPAVQPKGYTSSATSTPRKSHQTNAATSEAMAQWVKDIKSGVTPSKRSSGPLTPSSGRRATSNYKDDDSLPGTPSRSGLRDRSSIKVKTLFDPSPVTTPTRSRNVSSKSNTPVIAATSRSPVKGATVATHSHSQTKTSIPASPVKPLILHARGMKRYAVNLGFCIDEPDFGKGRWDENEARKRIKRCVEALEAGKRTDVWTKSPGSVELVRMQ